MKYQDAAAGAYVWIASVVTPEVSTGVLGVPLNLVVACAAGAYASFAWGESVEPRARMYRLFVSCIIIGCAFTALVNGVVGYTFPKFQLTDGVQAGIGAVMSCLTRFIVPALIDAIKSGEWREWIPFLRKRA